jgi:hypothetical protein
MTGPGGNWCADHLEPWQRRDSASRSRGSGPEPGAATGGAAEDLRALCRRAEKAKGDAAVTAICTRLGITRLSTRGISNLKPQQEQELRAALEALLA